MERRTFMALVSSGLLAAPRGAESQQAGKVPRIALLFANTPMAELIGPQPTSPYLSAFLKGMRDLGWIEGQNIVIERRSAEGQPDRFTPLVNEVLGLNVTLMMITGPPSAVRQAHQASATLPIVLAGTTAPEELVRLGLIKSIARPGGSVTGLTTVTGPEIRDKRLQLLKQAVPKARRIAYLGAEPSLKDQTEATARALNLTLLPAEVSTPRDFDRAFAAVRRDRADALFLGDSAFFWGHRHRIIEFAANQRLPAIYTYRIFVESGGLMAYGTDYADLYRRAATYVDKILKGAKPGDLPIEQPTKFELLINLKTAKALGLTIPQSVLQRADEIIQ